ncbi:MAG: UTRA domain-containing protein [Rhizobiaceae bacterium]|nr:UTRA domain-containing protein [Rhizobiaceae bacterium]
MAGSWREIRDEIARRIAAREWRAGAAIPGEAALAVEFGAARATVNRALQDLARAGLVERRRRAGSRVAAQPVREARFVIPLVRQEIEAQGRSYGYALLSREEIAAPEAVRARLGLQAGAPMLFLRCLHTADGAPYQLERRWISLDAVPEARDENFAAAGPNEWLVENAPFSTATFSFFAARAGEEERELLGLSEGEPVFVAERLTHIGDKAVTLVRLAHPSSHRMVTRI